MWCFCCLVGWLVGFSFPRNLHAVFHSGMQNCVAANRTLGANFLFICICYLRLGLEAILVTVRGYLIVDYVCVSLMGTDAQHFLCICQPFVFHLLKMFLFCAHLFSLLLQVSCVSHVFRVLIFYQKHVFQMISLILSGAFSCYCFFP